MSRGLRFSSMAALPVSMRAKLDQQRQTSGKDPVVIEIPMRTPTLNEWQRLHWSKRRKLGKLIASAINEARLPPPTPIARCVITVERTSTQEPDKDGLYGGLKPLLDALQPASTRHPYGLGFIADDGHRCLIDLIARHVPGRAERTRITIEPRPADGQENTTNG